MSWSTNPGTKNATNYVFQVVVEVGGIYCPISIVKKPPPDNDLPMRVNKLWVMDRTRLMYEFLSNKDPRVRCNLQAEVDLATEQNTQHWLWFRKDRKQLCQGQRPEVEAQKREQMRRDPESTWYPYTTLGILNCIYRQDALGSDGYTATSWAQDSLKTVIEGGSNHAIVVFDITDLDNISLAVIDDTGHIQTMREHCLSGDDVVRHPVITSLDLVPSPGYQIMQLIFDDENLRDWANGPLNLKRENQKPTLSRIVKDEILSIRNPEVGREMMDRMFQDHVRLASIPDLTCEDLIKVVLSTTKVVKLSFSSKLLVESSLEDLKYLVIVLARLKDLEAVYITDPLGIPGGNMKGTLQLARSAAFQGAFFARILPESEPFWRKVHGSSVYSWRLSSMLVRCVDDLHAEMVSSKVDACFEDARDVYHWQNNIDF